MLKLWKVAALSLGLLSFVPLGEACFRPFLGDSQLQEQVNVLSSKSIRCESSLHRCEDQRRQGELTLKEIERSLQSQEKKVEDMWAQIKESQARENECTVREKAKYEEQLITWQTSQDNLVEKINQLHDRNRADLLESSKNKEDTKTVEIKYIGKALEECKGRESIIDSELKVCRNTLTEYQGSITSKLWTAVVLVCIAFLVSNLWKDWLGHKVILGSHAAITYMQSKIADVTQRHPSVPLDSSLHGPADGVENQQNEAEETNSDTDIHDESSMVTADPSMVTSGPCREAENIGHGFQESAACSANRVEINNDTTSHETEVKTVDQNQAASSIATRLMTQIDGLYLSTFCSISGLSSIQIIHQEEHQELVDNIKIALGSHTVQQKIPAVENPHPSVDDIIIRLHRQY